MKANCPDNLGLPGESAPAFTDVSVRHRVLRFEKSKYEVVIGAFRLKAARLAELEAVGGLTAAKEELNVWRLCPGGSPSRQHQETQNQRAKDEPGRKSPGFWPHEKPQFRMLTFRRGWRNSNGRQFGWKTLQKTHIEPGNSKSPGFTSAGGNPDRYVVSKDISGRSPAQRLCARRPVRAIHHRLMRMGGTDHKDTRLEMQSKFRVQHDVEGRGVGASSGATLRPTKFIVTDDPVTFYCKTVFPSEWVYPNEMSPKQIGARTIFPLTLDSYIIITHMQLVRDPWSTPTEMRTDARSYQSAMKHLGDIQFGRELEENEVLRINYILKRRAVRYMAAAEEEWLYPERHVSTTEWADLDEDWFLFPHLWKVPFHREIIVGHVLFFC
jgi:hypothetical protein